MSTCTAPVVHTDIKALAAELGRPAGITRPRSFILRPAFNRHGAWLHGDGRQLCISRQPLLDAARILLTEGVSPETPIATRHAGAGFDALTVRESETQSPTFVRWKAFSRDDVQAPMRSGERPVPDPLIDADRFHDSDGGPA